MADTTAPVPPLSPDTADDVIVPVTITAPDDAPTRGEMRVRRLTSGGRMWRAARVLGFCWLLAIGFVLVPILHWVLVPGMFLAGPLIAMNWLKYDREVAGGTGTCPVCRSALTIGRATHPEGFSLSCPACRSVLRVAPA